MNITCVSDDDYHDYCYHTKEIYLFRTKYQVVLASDHPFFGIKMYSKKIQLTGKLMENLTKTGNQVAPERIQGKCFIAIP